MAFKIVALVTLLQAQTVSWLGSAAAAVTAGSGASSLGQAQPHRLHVVPAQAEPCLQPCSQTE